jgi:hypothetical protein
MPTRAPSPEPRSLTPFDLAVCAALVGFSALMVRLWFGGSHWPDRDVGFLVWTLRLSFVTVPLVGIWNATQRVKGREPGWTPILVAVGIAAMIAVVVTPR